MMNKMNIVGHGSMLHGQLARFTEKTFRVNQWGGLLIDNESGKIVNNTSGALHYEDHKRMLDDVVAARKYFPTVYAALSAAPGIAVSSSLYETLIGYSDMNEFDAKTSMDGSGRESNQTDYRYNWVPQPIYHCDFHIPWRQQGFAYKQADGSSEATMQVALERDRTLMLGNPGIVVNVNGVDAPLYGLTNHPDILALPAGISNWALEASSDLVYKEAVNLIKELFTTRKAAQSPNSVVMFVANDVYPMLELDYATEKGDRTNMERIKAITSIRDVLPSQWLPDGAVLLVEVSPMTLRIPQASDIVVAPWTRTDPMEALRFTVFAASTLQIRKDRNGNTGLLYATK